MLCSNSTCARKVHSTRVGLCLMHYKRLWRRGLIKNKLVIGDDKERFLSHVHKTDDCWLWNGCIDKFGYGASYFKGKRIFAHRLSYMLFVGDLDSSKQIDHLCFVRECVNPNHLEQVSAKVNVNRMLDKHGVRFLGKRPWETA